MERYRNFRIASYMYAYYAAEATDDQIRKDTETYLKYLPLGKVYVEKHRGMTDISVDRLYQIRKILEEYDISVSGGITSTGLVDNSQKPALFDTFCYTDPKHREEYLRIVRETAEVFDEIILDDYFFTSCRCELCIAEKGSRSWKDFRQEQMKQFSEKIVEEAHRINPRMNFIIKYPNWHESYQATGYNPGIQKNVFDMIYTGTESREPYYSAQHMQRYLSYGIMRLLENAAPGCNGGAWIDLGGSSGNLNCFLEQAEFSLLGGARELMLFNFESLLSSPALAALETVLRKTDHFLQQTGRPHGLAVWEPFDAEGEDQLCSYLGMCGLALEQTPDFPEEASTVLFTERTACVPDAAEKLEAFVRNGGRAIITTGFLHAAYDQGIRDMTSVRLTHRHVMGREYMIDLCDHDYSDIYYVRGTENVMFEVLDYKTNATWADILMLDGACNFPVLTEDFYGKGRLLILNVPENFADLYKLPAEVVGIINKELSFAQPCYVKAEPKVSLIFYDNCALCLHSYRPMQSAVQLVVRGEGKLTDLQTGAVYDYPILLPGPRRKGDAALTRYALPEYAYEIGLNPGESRFFILK